MGIDVDGSINTYPTGYNIGILDTDVAFAAASKYLTASSADPGTFVVAGTPSWASQTICIYPGKATAAATGIASGESILSSEITYTTNLLDNLEKGADGDSVAGSGSGGTWTITTAGTSRAEIDTAQFVSGTSSLRLYRDGTNNPEAKLAHVPVTGESLSLKDRKDDTSSFVYWIGNGSKRFGCFIKADEHLYYYNGGDVDTGKTVAINTWFTLVFTNVDFEAGTFDIILDGSAANLDTPMISDAYATNIALFANSTGTSEAWIDDVEFYTQELTLSVDGVIQDTEYINSGVPDNTQPLTFMTGVAYANEITVTVEGVEQAHFHPDTMILGSTYSTGTVTVTNGDAIVTGAGGAAWTDVMTGSVFVSADGLYYTVDTITDATHLELSAVYAGGTLGGQTYTMKPKLPDLVATGGYNDGRIFWGTNPADVTATIGPLVASDQASAGATTTQPSPDLLRSNAGGTNWFADPDETAPQDNPLYMLVKYTSETGGLSTFTETQVWRFFGLWFVLILTAAAALIIRGHLLVASVVCCVAIWFMVHLTIFPMVILVAVIPVLLVGLVMERSPSV
jgi:hypothetical protein